MNAAGKVINLRFQFSVVHRTGYGMHLNYGAIERYVCTGHFIKCEYFRFVLNCIWLSPTAWTPNESFLL